MGPDLLTVLERAGVDDDRLAEVETLIDLAAAAAAEGRAGAGSIVTVTDRAGRTARYELVGHTEPGGACEAVPLGSPAGRALAGTLPGDHVLLPRPNGRRRRVRVLSVE